MCAWHRASTRCVPALNYCSAIQACAARSSAPSILCTWPTTSRRLRPLSVNSARSLNGLHTPGRRRPMPQTLLEKLPSDFKTLPLHVEANPDTLSYQSLGEPLNFSQMLARRRPVEITDPQRFSVRLANLGVSVRLTLEWQGRDYWLLVRQQRQDRGDVVLKLISGYVPAQELGLPLDRKSTR